MTAALSGAWWNAIGKEVTVTKGQIQKRIESPASLMPANFAEIIPAYDFNKLMAWLLTK